MIWLNKAGDERGNTSTAAEASAWRTVQRRTLMENAIRWATRHTIMRSYGFDHHEARVVHFNIGDIADYLGLTIETVSRTLSQLERDAVIEIPTARQIRLKNPAALQGLHS